MRRARGRQRRPARGAAGRREGWRDAWGFLSCVQGVGLREPSVAPVSVVTIAVSKDIVVIVVARHESLASAILNLERAGRAVRERTVRRREMTLAGQFLLLQVLIVLAVLVAVSAISLAQTARAFERSEVRPALNAAENLAANPAVRQRIQHARPFDSSGLASVAESVRTVSGSTSVFLARTDRVVLVSSDPSQVGEKFRLGARKVLAGAAWTGNQHAGGGTV